MSLLGNERIPKNEATYPIRDLFGEPRDDRTTVGMSNQHEIAQVGSYDLVDKVFDLLREIDSFLDPHAVTQHRRRSNRVALLLKSLRHRQPMRSGMPRTVNK